MILLVSSGADQKGHLEMLFSMTVLAVVLIAVIGSGLLLLQKAQRDRQLQAQAARVRARQTS
jgi:hypothetical protein